MSYSGAVRIDITGVQNNARRQPRDQAVQILLHTFTGLSGKEAEQIYLGKAQIVEDNDGVLNYEEINT